MVRHKQPRTKIPDRPTPCRLEIRCTPWEMDASLFAWDDHFWTVPVAHPVLGNLTAVVIPERNNKPPENAEGHPSKCRRRFAHIRLDGHRRPPILPGPITPLPKDGLPQRSLNGCPDAMTPKRTLHSAALVIGAVFGVFLAPSRDDELSSAVFMIVPYFGIVAAISMRLVTSFDLGILNDAGATFAASCGASAWVISCGWYAIISFPLWWLFFLMPVYVTTDYLINRQAPSGD